MGIDEKFLQETHLLAVEKFEWIKQVISPIHYSSLHLLDLFFYQESRCKKELETYQQEISSLIKPLCQYVLKHKDFSQSRRFVYLMTFLPIPNSQKFNLFVQWLQTFPQTLTSTDNGEEAYLHVYELALSAKKQRLFEIVEVPLDMNSDSSSENQILTSSSVTKIIRQIFYKNQN